jgi:hypothetical protein
MSFPSQSYCVQVPHRRSSRGVGIAIRLFGSGLRQSACGKRWDHVSLFMFNFCAVVCGAGFWDTGLCGCKWG